MGFPLIKAYRVYSNMGLKLKIFGAPKTGLLEIESSKLSPQKSWAKTLPNKNQK